MSGIQFQMTRPVKKHKNMTHMRIISQPANQNKQMGPDLT